MKRLLAASLLLVMYSASNAQSDKLLLVDDFSTNDNSWPIKNNDEESFYYLSDGKYVIGGTGTSPRWCGIQQYIDPSKNWSISAVASHIRGKNNFGYGLFFGAKDVINGYVFSITANGYFDLAKYDGKWSKLMEYKASSSIKQGNNVENKITVKKNGSNWEFYINDQYVARYPAQEPLGNYAGFFKDHQQQVEFDDLHIAVSDAGGFAASGSGMKELYNDDFSETTYLWDDRQTKTFTTTIKDGKLTHHVFGNESAIFSTRGVPADLDKNYTLQLNASSLSGQSNKGFGMTIWGGNDFRYRFLITSDGSYSLYREKTALINWTKSTAIKPGSNATNKLAIKKEGNQWKLYINDQWVNSTTVDSLSYLNVGACTDNGLKVEYDNLAAFGYQKEEKGWIEFDNDFLNPNIKEVPDYSKGKKLNSKGSLVQLYPKLVELANDNFEKICGSLRKDQKMLKEFNSTLGLTGMTESYITYNSMFGIMSEFYADFGPYSTKEVALQQLEELQRSFKAPYFAYKRIKAGLPELLILQNNSNGFTYFGSTITINYDEKAARYYMSLKMKGKPSEENFFTISTDASDNSTFSLQVRNVLAQSKSGFKTKGYGMVKHDAGSKWRYYKTDLRLPGALDCLIERYYSDDDLKIQDSESFEAYFEKDVSLDKANATIKSLLQKMTNALGSQYVYAKTESESSRNGKPFEVTYESYDFYKKENITSSFNKGVSIVKEKNDDDNYDVTILIRDEK